MLLWTYIFQITVFIFFRHIPRSRIAGSYIIIDLFLGFWGIFKLFSTVATWIYNINSIQAFPFLYIPVNICSLWSFWQQPLWQVIKVIPHCGFEFHFSDDQRCWASFHVSVGSANYLNSLELRYCICKHCLLKRQLWRFTDKALVKRTENGVSHMERA